MHSIGRGHIHLGIWLLVLSHTLIARIASYPPGEWLYYIASTNLVVAAAFLVIIHLLTDQVHTTPPERREYMAFGIVALIALVGGVLGTRYDVAFLMALIAGYYFSGLAQIQDRKFIGLVYLALSINGFFAPLLFMLYKDLILISEVEFAAALNRLIGLDVSAIGTRLTSDSGMRLQMIGACSVFSNLSVAFLGYASFKAYFRMPMGCKDIYTLLVLAACLIIMNAIRLGLMTPSMSAYEFWHHGHGAIVFAVAQMALICLISASSAVTFRPAWRA